MQKLVNKIYCNDTLETLKKFPDNFIHLTVTSPPYNVGINYEIANDSLDYKDYMKKVFSEVYRITVSGGRLVVNLPSSILQSAKSAISYLSIEYVLFLREIGWLDREWINWIKTPKGEIPGQSTSWGSWLSPSMPYLRDAFESIVVMDKKQHKRFDKKGKNDITKDEFMKFTSNCWCIPTRHIKEHPAVFSEQIPYRLIKLYTWQDDVVLDPFVGSGTTCIVAKQLGRQYIGIDNSPAYCKLANNALKQNVLSFNVKVKSTVSRRSVCQEQIF